jgi:hypothetical protein
MELGENESDMDSPGTTVGTVVWVRHQETSPSRQDGLVLRTGVSENGLAQRASRPFEHRDSTGCARTGRRNALRPGWLASLLLFCDDDIWRPVFPLAKIDLMYLAVACVNWMSDPRSLRVIRLGSYQVIPITSVTPSGPRVRSRR